jgi:hypothetical protein
MMVILSETELPTGKAYTKEKLCFYFLKINFGERISPEGPKQGSLGSGLRPASNQHPLTSSRAAFCFFGI